LKTDQFPARVSSWVTFKAKELDAVLPVSVAHSTPLNLLAVTGGGGGVLSQVRQPHGVVEGRVG